MSEALCQEVALTATLRARDDLARAARAVPPDRQLWVPGGATRHTVYIVAHAAAVNRFFAAALAEQPLPYRSIDEREAAARGCATLEQAETFLNRSVTAVCNAIVSLPAERVAATMIMPWGERMLVALGLLAPAQHMMYHVGQVALIQNMLGDREDH